MGLLLPLPQSLRRTVPPRFNLHDDAQVVVDRIDLIGHSRRTLLAEEHGTWEPVSDALARLSGETERAHAWSQLLKDIVEAFPLTFVDSIAA
jgi:hypothetical protein